MKQRYGPKHRCTTFASLKPDISLAKYSLLDDIMSNNDAKVLRTAFKRRSQFSGSKITKDLRKVSKICPLCKQGRRPRVGPLSKRMLIPFSRGPSICESCASIFRSRRSHHRTRFRWFWQWLCKSTKCSGRNRSDAQVQNGLRTYNKHVVNITVDSGAEISMIWASVTEHIRVKVNQTKQHAPQADNSILLENIGGTHFRVVRDNLSLHIEALVVKDLDVDIIATYLGPTLILYDIGTILFGYRSLTRVQYPKCAYGPYC